MRCMWDVEPDQAGCWVVEKAPNACGVERCGSEAAASSESDVHRHAGYARIRRWRGSEDVWGCGMGGPSSPPGRHPHASARVWVFVECLVNRHVSHPFHTHTLRINYIAGLQRRRKYTQPGNAIANPLYFDTQRETALLGIPPLSFVVALGSRYWLGRAERGRDHASLAAHL